MALPARQAGPVKKTKWYRQLYFWVIVAIILGVLVGWLCPGFGTAMEPIGTTFVTAMRMLIGPIVFLTIVAGIASVANIKQVGSTGIKALVYFQFGTLLAMATGLVAINLIPLGNGVNADASTIETSERRQQSHRKGREPAVVGVPHPHRPASMVDPFVEGDILQIIFLAVIFGVALNAVGPDRRPDAGPGAARHQGHLQDPVLHHEARPAGRVRRHGLRHRQVRRLHPDQPRRPDRPVLPDVGVLRPRRPRLRHGLPEAEHLQTAALPEGGTAADRRHLHRRTGAARPDAQDGVRRRHARRSSGSSSPPGTASTSTAPRSTCPWPRCTSPRPPTPT